jgi:hypothetical protein
VESELVGVGGGGRAEVGAVEGVGAGSSRELVSPLTVSLDTKILTASSLDTKILTATVEPNQRLRNPGRVVSIVVANVLGGANRETG